MNILIDFLMRELHAKILNQQTLWTKDNEEAQFFKGQRVGFQTQISISDTGGRATSNFTYEKVGMTLRARPSITPEKNVDMIINVILSQLDVGGYQRPARPDRIGHDDQHGRSRTARRSCWAVCSSRRTAGPTERSPSWAICL